MSLLALLNSDVTLFVVVVFIFWWLTLRSSYKRKNWWSYFVTQTAALTRYRMERNKPSVKLIHHNKWSLIMLNYWIKRVWKDTKYPLRAGSRIFCLFNRLQFLSRDFSLQALRKFELTNRPSLTSKSWEHKEWCFSIQLIYIIKMVA